MLETLRSVLRFRPIGRDRVERRLARCADVDDLRAAAKRRLPSGVFDYIDGAAEDEITLAANAAAWRGVRLAPRVLRDVSKVDLSTTLLGRPVPAPLALSPIGFARIADPQGELAAARAAAARGLPYTLSTLGTRSIEEVAAVSTGPKWFQVYVWRDRGLVRDMVQRAVAEGYEALLVTVDTAVFGRRERDVRRGFTLPPTVGLATIVDGVKHPGWTWSFLRGGPITFSNVAGSSTATAVTLSDFVNSQFDPSLSWRDLDWLRGISDLPVLLKGIGAVADARIAASEGLPGLVISNHGGRQLDRAPATLDLLEATVDAVGDSVEVLIDGGVRRGADLVVARALGARAVMVGRPVFYGLGAAGERGAGHALDQLLSGAERTMALLGAATLDDVTRDMVVTR
ncbi:MAG TPA: alpha-hydroxy acid oxidase [Acidimicrobiales bacterium]|nr:alpha-hydroxy acid oxidase [Acidimicrobiales bacterium]